MTTEYFYCYDMNLFNFLKSKGIRFITKARHHKSGDLFSLYEQSKELSDALHEWEHIATGLISK